MDLIYGLPRQSPESFARTLAQVNELRPDRIALYAYAHLPERFKPQRRIIGSRTARARRPSWRCCRSRSTAFQEAGYVYVGMDHFALPNDALAVAKRQGRLHRNFQGYSTQPDCDLIGLGVSAIGKVGATYSQNAKTMEEYCDLLDQGRLPVVRGLALSRDDLARRAVIMALMCQGQVLFESIELAWLLDFKQYFAPELEAHARPRRQGPGRARRCRHPGHEHGLVLRARRRHGVRPLPAGRPQPRQVLAHHLRRQTARCPPRLPFRRC